jgi:hypothetical protein
MCMRRANNGVDSDGCEALKMTNEQTRHASTFEVLDNSTVFHMADNNDGWGTCSYENWL